MTGWRIAAPVRGEPPRAAWAAQVTEACNSLSPIGGAGVLVRDGAQGRGFAPVPANLRDRRGAGTAETPGCFQIALNGEGKESFANRYYMRGDILFGEVGDITIEELASAAVGQEPGAYDLFICLKVRLRGLADGGTPSEGSDEPPPAPGEIIALTGETLQAEQWDEMYAVIPLYLLAVVAETVEDDTGETEEEADESEEEADEPEEQKMKLSWAVKCDFRKVPVIQAWENIV